MTPIFCLNTGKDVSHQWGRSGTWFESVKMNIKDVKETFKYGLGVQWSGLGCREGSTKCINSKLNHDPG